jgi:hypothetical protein
MPYLRSSDHPNPSDAILHIGHPADARLKRVVTRLR